METKLKFRVIADYPDALHSVGYEFETYANGILYVTEQTKKSALDYPHLFKNITNEEVSATSPSLNEEKEKAFEKIVRSINYKHGRKNLHCELTVDEFVEIESILNKESLSVGEEAVSFANWLVNNFEPFSYSQNSWQNKYEEEPFIPVINGKDVFETQELYQIFLKREGK